MKNLKTEQIPLKRITEFFEENPNHIKNMNYQKLDISNGERAQKERLMKNPEIVENMMQENRRGLVSNTEHFFQQCDVIALLDFLSLRDIRIEMRGRKDLLQSVDALSKFKSRFNEYKFEMEKLKKEKQLITNN